MKIELRAPGTHWSSDVGGFRLSDWKDVDELLAFRDARRVAEPGTQLLFVLDDSGQAAYTSGHARDKHGLLEFDEGELPSDEKLLYEKDSRLTPERWASLLVTRLRAKSTDTTLAVSERLIPIDDAAIDLLSLYEDVRLVFQSPLDCLAVAATDPSMAIAALPNGYFVDDLTPMENYLLAEQLRSEFGYEILGLGSFLAAYVRDEAVSTDEARAVVESVRGLYWKMTDEVASQWADTLSGRRWLLLSYRGN